MTGAVRMRWQPVIPVAAGCGLLLARPAGPPLALAGVYAALGAMAMLAPSAPRRAPLLRPLTALVVGFAAVALTPLVVGQAPPVRAAGMVAIALNTGAAVAEEALFRRLLYGRLERWGAVVAVGGAALVFVAVHLPFYGVGAMPVDLGAGLLFGWQRWATGSWGVSAATHAWANLVPVIA